jgi:deoxynucleoside kinase
MSPVRISIDGCISSGKTAAIQSIASKYDVSFVLEPVESWKTMLGLMYKDQAKWAMAFNIDVLLSMDEFISKEGDESMIIYERSPMSCRYVFSEIQKKLGYMTDIEMSIVDKVFQRMVWIPDIIVYIRTSTEVSYDRMKKRGRPCENCVDISYLETLHDQYEAFMSKLKNEYPSIEIIYIDGDMEKDEVNIAISQALKTRGFLQDSM